MTERSRIYVYSLIKALYDRGRDYIDAFWPLVLQILPDGRPLSAVAIRELVLERYALRIPLNSLLVILDRAVRRDQVQKGPNGFLVTTMGVETRKALELERDTERRINELLDDAATFLEERGLGRPDRTELLVLLQAFLSRHLGLFAEVLARGTGELVEKEPSEEAKVTPSDAALVAYFFSIEDSNPTLFAIFRDMLFGSIIATLVYSPALESAAKGFARTHVYLDSNLAFFVLGLHYDEFNRPAQELFELMKSTGVFHFKIFDFTIDEMASVLRNYPVQSYMYLPEMRVNSILSSLRSKGWTPADAREFIAKLEVHLASKGIGVQPTRVDLRSYAPPRELGDR